LRWLSQSSLYHTHQRAETKSRQKVEEKYFTHNSFPVTPLEGVEEGGLFHLSMNELTSCHDFVNLNHFYKEDKGSG